MTPEQLAEMISTAPSHIKALPIHKGYPVPYFVHRDPDWEPGQPIDFRVTSPDAMRRCVMHNRCWITGTVLGTHKAFVGGPVSALMQNYAEPPSRPAAAMFAAQVCPFMIGGGGVAPIQPGTRSLAGDHVTTGTGVTFVYVTREFTVHSTATGTIWRPGEVEQLDAFKDGRKATRDEIEVAINAGVELLFTKKELSTLRLQDAVRQAKLIFSMMK